MTGSIVCGGRVEGSAMHLPLIRCCGRIVVQWAHQSGLPPSCSKSEHSVVAERVTAITADLRSLHSLHLVAVGTI